MAGVFDFRKEDKALYLPPEKPVLVEVPMMQFIAVDGQGNPNTAPAYQEAVAISYGLSYVIKMMKMKGMVPAGYFDFVVGPLEGLWWFADGNAPPEDLMINKDALAWTSLIRMPGFVTGEVFEQAKAQLARKKPELQGSRARLITYAEGLCAQVMHRGPYDTEPDTIRALAAFIDAEGFRPDLGGPRRHHEIYLSDPRKTAPEKMKTVIRHPIVSK